jgi:hypothetical protein
VTISAEDRLRLRSLPAYRRAIWGMRMALAGIPGLLLVAVSAGLGVPRQIGLPLTVAVLGMVFAGIFIFWSGALPLNRSFRTLAARYSLDVYERSTVLGGGFVRDLIGLRGKAGSRS